MQTVTRKAADPDREVLDTCQAAAFLGISERSLFNLIVPRGDLPYSMLGGARRFLKADLVAYVQAHRVTATAEGGAA